MESRPSPFDVLKPIAGRALQFGLNRLLALDPDAAAALVGLEGKRVELQLSAPPLAFAVQVRNGRLQVGPVQTEGEPDLGLRTSIGGLLAQLPFLRADNTAPVGKLRINGDADLARRLQQLAQGFDPDWDKPFADLLGPLLGPQVARTLREGLRGGSRFAGNLARDAAEFITEESRDVVAKAELSAFHDDVDELRDRAERLLARASRLAGFDGVAG